MQMGQRPCKWGKGHQFLAVTRPITLVLCAKSQKLATVKVQSPFGWGEAYDSSQSSNAASIWRASDGQWPARSPLRSAISARAASGALDRGWRISGLDEEHLCQRCAFLAGQISARGARRSIFHAHAACDPGHAARCSGPLHGTCGTLLHRQQRASRCRHDR